MREFFRLRRAGPDSHRGQASSPCDHSRGRVAGVRAGAVGRDDRERRPADAACSPRRRGGRGTVGGGWVCRPVRGVHADRGRARRPVRAPWYLCGGVRALWARVGRSGAGRRLAGADRCSGGAGRRCGADAPGVAGDDHRALPRLARALLRARGMGRHRHPRLRVRSIAGRRADHGRGVACDLLDQPADRRCGRRHDRGARTATATATATDQPGRHRARHTRTGFARRRDH
jgi:hypothetical protein